MYDEVKLTRRLILTLGIWRVYLCSLTYQYFNPLEIILYV